MLKHKQSEILNIQRNNTKGYIRHTVMTQGSWFDSNMLGQKIVNYMVVGEREREGGGEKERGGEKESAREREREERRERERGRERVRERVRERWREEVSERAEREVWRMSGGAEEERQN